MSDNLREQYAAAVTEYKRAKEAHEAAEGALQVTSRHRGNAYEAMATAGQALLDSIASSR